MSPQSSLAPWGILSHKKQPVEPLTLRQRAHLYNTHQKFCEYAKRAPLVATDAYLFGWWVIGSDYSNATDFYGAYPHGYLDRMGAIFPDFPPEDTLHLFSGSLNGRRGFRVDLRLSKRHPQLLTDAHQLAFRPSVWGIIYADPPYSKSDAEKYGTKMITRRLVVRECIRALRPRGFLIWLDEVYPQFSKAECRLTGHIAITRSTNHRERSAFIFQKHARPHPVKRKKKEKRWKTLDALR